MAFRSLAPTPRVRNAEARDSFRIGVHVASGKATDPSAVFGLTFVVGVNLLTQFGWKMGDRVAVQEGTGPDTGTFLVTKVEQTAGSVKITRSTGNETDPDTGTFKVNLIHTETLRHIRESIPLEAATFQHFGGQVFVCVPWAKEPKA